MFEALKNKMKISLKVVKKKTNKKSKEVNKYLKENVENIIKQVKEIIQNLRMEITTIKKTQTERGSEMENRDKWSGTTNVNIETEYKR